MENPKATIVEQALTGKHGDTDCEDGIVVSKYYIAVIDGSTSKTEEHYHPFMRNGRYAMMLIGDFLRNQASPLWSMEQFCEKVTQKVHAAYPADDKLPRQSPKNRLCASVVACNLEKKEIWMIGDCQCCVDGQLYTNDKPCEAAIAEKRSKFFPSLLNSHPDMVEHGRLVHDYARESIMGDLVESMKGENISYAVIDGYKVFIPGVKVIKLYDGQHHDIILASDGYPFLKPTLAESENALQRQLDNDPFNISTFKATKGLMAGNVSFDDRAFIRFVI